MNQHIYQLISFLLNYPTEEMIDILPEIEREIEEQSNSQITGNIKQFIQQSKEMSLDDWITHYIEHFDFGRLTNLYVTYLKLGEQRERGLELLKLKKYYEAHGFEVTDKELPDYLPVILEFCANVSVEASNELLSMHQQAIGEIHGKLQENNSYYSLLFDALFLYMEENGVTAVALEEA
ncbi:nitrate reductase molybdenum cofactor assembly chaperone [Oceanobacillus profundus]|uniref:Nitrate reductase molybdenum cofactor assembly chaperone n=1 Tax=Oceanobacillus profundus TaxID=372463 RepID=A0A417YCZ2_9BACI|nr:nitrate reductase molybdenum cofactor assembly chaperone [Oceanobacillus profundus]MBR3118240.1 nitrate reductase molybdenum cofactor assembly chaperone [Oceanobacillus sp.]PAE27099.1 nitrate reductase molybdenum cofactor assembly chaperone [Paenibacillus sp. 7884-2]MCM3397743.1 nitrate reductase molybdenum cofactor assembly chaperone [Oceanobacillus profundus]MDO6449037.1 nitrate reductase molybdenum cofactor assembly chaperone [Oceanobacillus profundus]RHW30489.1 nitrate reductase molybde